MLARGESLRTREELMALARAGRMRGGLEPAAVRAVIDRVAAAEVGRDLAEPLELLRASLSPGPGGPTAAAVIRAGRGVALSLTVQDEIWIDGFTVHPDALGRSDVTVYFRPIHEWRGRRLWMHGYPEGSSSFVSFDPAPPAFDGWKVGELAWERFVLPAGVRFTTYVGMSEGARSGAAVPLGWVPR